MASYSCIVAPSDPGGYDYHYVSLSAALPGVANALSSSPHNLATNSDKITFYLANGDYSQGEDQLIETITSTLSVGTYYSGGDGSAAWVKIIAVSGDEARGRYRGGTSLADYHWQTSGTLCAPAIKHSGNWVSLAAGMDGVLFGDFIVERASGSGRAIDLDAATDAVACRRMSIKTADIGVRYDCPSFTRGSNSEGVGDVSFCTVQHGDHAAESGNYEYVRLINNTYISNNNNTDTFVMSATTRGEMLNCLSFADDDATGSTDRYPSLALTEPVDFKTNATLTDDSAHNFDSPADQDPTVSGNLGETTNSISVSGDLDSYATDGDIRPQSASPLADGGTSYSGMFATICGDTATYPSGTALPSTGGDWVIGSAEAIAGAPTVVERRLPACI